MSLSKLTGNTGKDRITVGDFEVLHSGTVIGEPDQPITFHIAGLVFELSFINDPAEKPGLRHYIPDDKGKLVLEFVNFNNTLGSGSITPYRVATLSGRYLYLSYRVYALTDKTGKLVHYTWLLGEQDTSDAPD